MLISLSEYAKIHDRSAVSVRQMAQRGRFKTAQKIGWNWAIDENEPYPDNRVKLGKYKNKGEKNENYFNNTTH